MKAFAEKPNPPAGARVPEGRIVAFRCPGCGCGVMSAVDMLSLTGRAVPGRRAGFRLRCANPECGLKDSDVFGGLSVEPISGGDSDRVRVTFPCILCGGKHTAVLSAGELAEREFFSLPCPNYGADVFFAGEIRRVKYELSRSELEMLDMMGGGDEADISLAADRDAALPDPEISETLTAAARLLEDEGAVICSCPDRREKGYEPDPAGSRLSFELTPHAVIVSCTGCGAKKLIPAVSYNAARDFAESDGMILDEQ